MSDDFASKATDGSWNAPLSAPDGQRHEADPVRPALEMGDSATALEPAGPRPALVPVAIHPLDRRDNERPVGERPVEERLPRDEALRIRLAWAKLLWLLAFLAVLLAISYLVPLIAENTQYAVTRGKQRAEHDFAIEHLAGSPLEQLSRGSQMVSQAVAPSVVHISTQGSQTDIFATPMRGMRTQIPSEGQGSGIVVDAAGYILTNLHVISSAREINVTLADGRKVKGQVVGVDDDTDLAVLKIDADRLTSVRWGDSDQAEPGGMVWAIGSPFGLERSITSGILSAKNRAGLAGKPYQNFLQTDTAVNPGNSGGPLVNTDGRVIGVNTAIVGDAYQGISFAIPSNVARNVYERIKDEGTVRRGWLGVQLEQMTDQHAKDLGLSKTTGAYISLVVQQADGGSPAAKAGIQSGDVVLRWNDREIAGPADLSNLVAQTEIGSTAQAVVFRQGKELTVEVTVGLRPPLP